MFNLDKFTCPSLVSTITMFSIIAVVFVTKVNIITVVDLFISVIFNIMVVFILLRFIDGTVTRNLSVLIKRFPSFVKLQIAISLFKLCGSRLWLFVIVTIFSLGREFISIKLILKGSNLIKRIPRSIKLGLAFSYFKLCCSILLLGIIVIIISMLIKLSSLTATLVKVSYLIKRITRFTKLRLAIYFFKVCCNFLWICNRHIHTKQWALIKDVRRA